EADRIALDRHRRWGRGRGRLPRWSRLRSRRWRHHRRRRRRRRRRLFEGSVANHPPDQARRERPKGAAFHTLALLLVSPWFYHYEMWDERGHSAAAHALDINAHGEAAVESRQRIHGENEGYLTGAKSVRPGRRHHWNEGAGAVRAVAIQQHSDVLMKLIDHQSAVLHGKHPQNLNPGPVRILNSDRHHVAFSIAVGPNLED